MKAKIFNFLNLMDEYLEEINASKRIELYPVIINIIDKNFLRYELKEIENDLIQISKQMNLNCSNKLSIDGALHVLTEGYTVGGHTRVVYNWVKNSINRNDVVFLNQISQEIPDFIKEELDKKGSILHNLTNFNLNQKVGKLLEISGNYKIVIIHQHPDDPVPTLAFGSNKYKGKIFFYNHADHRASLGYSISNMILELSEAGKDFSIKYRGIPENKITVMSIPASIGTVENKKNISLKNKTQKYITTMASEWKYKEYKEYDFKKFISMILQDKNICFNVIGIKEDSKEWCELKKRFPTQLNLMGLLKKEEVQEVFNYTDLYIDSFPYNSYTCVIEAILAGIPSISLKTKVLVLDSQIKTKVDTVQKLKEKIYEIFNCESEDLNNYVESLKKDINFYHGKYFLRDKEAFLYNYDKMTKVCIGKVKKDKFLYNYKEFYRQGKYNFIISFNCLKKLDFLTLINLFIIIVKADLLRIFISEVLIKVKRRSEWRTLK